VCVVDDDGRFRRKWTYARERLCRSAATHSKRGVRPS
jgi:hypothetical protein